MAGSRYGRRRLQGGASAGVAVLARKHTGVKSPPGGHVVCEGHVAGALIEAGATGGLVVYSVYLIEGDEMGNRSWSILEALSMHAAKHGLPSLACGDWNITPSTLAGSGWPDRLRAKVVILPVAHTTRSGGRSGRLIDFAVASDAVAHLGLRISVDGTAPIRTHDAFVVGLPMKPRQFEVTKMMTARHFPKDRPIGPCKAPPPTPRS